MKIAGIRFLNLNSLKGEQEIRFDEPPFTESGLFAITGPTGAGKTTILDAITVALYGRVHRHNKDAAEIMSRHTSECYSEVEFEVKDKRYRAKWSLRRSRGKVTGALQPVKMELAEMPGGTLIGGHTVTSVQQAIVELCGLDYNQFLRSVILSQGDFTRFLKADENERSELLEKITDTAVYSDISRFTFEKTKGEKEKLEALRAKLDDAELLSADDRKVHEDRLLELSAEEKTNKEKRSLVADKISWLGKLRALESRKAGLAAQLDEQRDLLEEHREDFKRLTMHKLAVEFRPTLAEIESCRQQSLRLKEELENLRDQLPLRQEENQSAAIELQESGKLVEAAQQELSASQGLLEKVIHLDSELEGMKDQVEKVHAAFNESCKEVELLVQKEEDKTKDFNTLEEKISKLQQWLNENKDDAGLESKLVLFSQHHKGLSNVISALESAKKELEHYLAQDKEDKIFLEKNSLAIGLFEKELSAVEADLDLLANRLRSDFSGRTQEELELEATELPSLISLCEQQLKLSEGYALDQDRVKELQQKIVRDNDLYHTQTQAIEALLKEKAAAENHLHDLRQFVELQQRIQKYDADRRQLQQDKPCPLCGSLHHPYVIDHYHGELTEAERKRNEQEKIVRELTDELNRKSVETGGTKLALKNSQDHLEQLTLGISENIREFTSNNMRLPKPLDIEVPETIRAIVRKKQNQLDLLQNSIKVIRGIKQQQENGQKSLSLKKEALVQAVSRSESVSARIQSAGEQVARLTRTINTLVDEQAELVSNLSVMLSPWHIEYNHQDAERIEHALSEKYGRYLKAKDLLQHLSQEHIRLNAEIKSIGQSLADRLTAKLKLEVDAGHEKEKYEKLKATRFELFGDKSPSKEWTRLDGRVKETRAVYEVAQRLLQTKQEQLKIAEAALMQKTADLEDSKQKLSELKDRLTNDLQVKGIPGVEALNELFLADEEVRRLAALEKSVETSIATLGRMFAVTENELEAEAARNLTTQPAEELEPLLDEIEGVISSINQEIGRVRKILEDDDRLKTRFAEVANDIEILQKEYTRWFRLSSLIGSADGRKFSRFAQGLTLARLTDLANRHLTKLSDRYRILKSKEKDLELQVVDRYQADAVRPMATLSGGESFLVSLALALGLSDLASKKVQINSLFIDEGFGTLDAETLDVAISALENLQAKGKSIGIISHVEALKERIGTQIQVNKQAGGSSTIRVLSYGNSFLYADSRE